jgi:hypothetical protein
MWSGESEPGEQGPARPLGDGAYGATAFGGRIFDGAAYGDVDFDGRSEDGPGRDGGMDAAGGRAGGGFDGAAYDEPSYAGAAAESAAPAYSVPQYSVPSRDGSALLDPAGFAQFPGRPARLKQAAAASRRIVAGPVGYPADEQAGVLRSWVAGWSHRIEMSGSQNGTAQQGAALMNAAPMKAASMKNMAPGADAAGEGEGEQRRPGDGGAAGVRRLAEAVVDVLLERRPAEHVRRLVSREVFGLLSSVARRRATARFARRCVVRSIRLHSPASDAVESTVLVQDGPRVRAVALRFERAAAWREAAPSQDQDRLEWRCTALQFA